MPIYEYHCRDCGEDLEITQRITEQPLEMCPSCGGALNKLISHTSFILKGTGWYATDYGRKDRPNSKGESKSEDKKPVADKSTEKTEKKEPSASKKES